MACWMLWVLATGRSSACQLTCPDSLFCRSWSRVFSIWLWLTSPAAGLFFLNFSGTFTLKMLYPFLGYSPLSTLLAAGLTAVFSSFVYPAC
jgi:hypothetical protein